MEYEKVSSTQAIYLASDNQLLPDKTSSRPKLFSQQEFTVLIKQLSLSKGKT
jgi:hypothetical protein